MADNQTLAALAEALMTARIAFVNGTAAEWTAANPVLLDGEIGVVTGTSPAQFKIGDGVKKWSELGWGNVTTLAQLAEDANHRLVTDAEKTKWNGKAEKTPATTTADGLMSAADKTKLNGVAAGANNYVHPSTHAATMITEDANHRFTTDAEKTKWNREYTIEKVATESGFASTYVLKLGANKVGASINIPLDQVLRGSSIKTVTAANTPYTGAKVSEKYIEFLFQNNSTPQYLPVQDLVDVYKGGRGISVSAENVISLNTVEALTDLTPTLKAAFDSVYDQRGAAAAAAKAALDEFKASTLIIQCTIPGMS